MIGPQAELAARAFIALAVARRSAKVHVGPGRRGLYTLHRAIANSSKVYHRMTRPVAPMPMGFTRQMRKQLARQLAA